MQNSPRPVSDDRDRPNAARLYDYYLGGAHNFAVDREFALRAVSEVPADAMVQHGRAFLRRAVKLCLERGIRQFLDLGSGIPTAGNVHEVAHEVDPDCRVVYVDNEPATVAHARAMLRGRAGVAMAEADVRDPAAVLASPECRELLDLTAPVAVLMVAILPCLVAADRPERVVAGYRDVMAAGSLLVFTHLTADFQPEVVDKLLGVATDAHPLTPRTKAEVEVLLDGFELLEPGLVLSSKWRREGDEPEFGVEAVSYGAVGLRR
ncbi:MULTISPECIES: SAM-dependent methyltransferase [Actinosynnema]|uniref:S-adenosyl methyltransferase n=1 Tax=Actinosynnema pretiosum TaxID=42197 RepID=A0A290ZDQ3_9PSEU|nr:SAM-dependent methyltransferase [Actinosynnema pretiosum]ATE57170.1 hypothetical protein CNX65_30960 [Actinosynnema pretiosum]